MLYLPLTLSLTLELDLRDQMSSALLRHKTSAVILHWSMPGPTAQSEADMTDNAVEPRRASTPTLACLVCRKVKQRRALPRGQDGAVRHSSFAFCRVFVYL